jgi:hypothetical protein
VVRFRSTHLKNLSASPAGGPPIASGDPAAAAGTTFGQGRCLVLEKSFGCTGPTSILNRYIVFRYSDSHKNDIY